MATEILPTNSADVVPVAPVVPVVRAALVVPEDPVDLVVRVALVVPEDPVDLVVRAALVVPEDPVDLVVRAALVVPESLVALVVPEDPAVPVALERELVLVEAAPEHAQAVAGLELDPVEVELAHVRLAVLPKNKSVTAVHHRGLVPVPKRVEDLAAAAAETTHGQAAIEAATAWAVAE
jgi:hypothetical protein